MFCVCMNEFECRLAVAKTTVTAVFCYYVVITQPSNWNTLKKDDINLSVKALMLFNASGCHDIYLDLKSCSASFHANVME